MFVINTSFGKLVVNLVMSKYEFMHRNLQGWAGLDEIGAGVPKNIMQSVVLVNYNFN